MNRLILVLVLLTNIVPGPTHAAPLSTAFTYQGRLTDNGQLANGIYDFQFRLFDAPTNGAQVPVVLGYPTVAVTNGLFTTGLDFGSNVFNGTTWWLEISLRPSGTFNEFTFLTPRQPLTPAPNALFSVNAALATAATTANGIVASAVSPAQLNTPSAPANGQVLSYNGRSLVWTNVSTVAAAWTLNGNAGTTSGGNFLGTTDNQPMEFKVSGQRAFRLEPNTNGAPNIIAGSPNNAVELGVVGATIAGGGATNYLGFSYTNRVAADTGTIGGGARNTIQTGAAGSTIGGGYFNTIEDNSFQSTIGAGSENTIQTYAFQSTIGGGYQNTIQNASFAVISGGVSNTVAESGGTIGGGQANRAFQFATISGGRGNVATPGGAIGGGFQNTIGADSYYSAIFGGYENIIGSNSVFATIAGGNHNTIQDKCIDAAIGGGSNNTIGGSALEATIGGGIGNRIQGGGNAGTICGGVQNTIQTNALWGTIPGGYRNLIGGSFCFAAGRRAIANHDGTFAWADSTDFDFSSTATNEFAVRATGGVRFVSGVDSNGVPVAGVSLPAGGGSWSTLSDRNTKAHFTPVNPRELLDRLAQLPIQSWNYKSQSESVRHIGPTAQDFHAAFTVGEDDQHIATVDADGVALAAIQGLNQKLEAELNRRDVEIRALRQQLDDLKTALGRETTPTKGGSQ